MANGAPIVQGTSKLLAGPLGVCKIFFDGWDLGKTVADAVLTPNQALKEIMYQQDGTVKADEVSTGLIYQLATTFGEINTEILKLMMPGIVNPTPDSMAIGREMYRSKLDYEARPLIVAAVDQYGIASELDENLLNFYLAVPNVDASLITWGADTQRELSVIWDIYFYTFPTGSWSYPGEFGYMGDPVALNLPPIVWPNRFGPSFESAAVETLTPTVIDVTLSEASNLVTGPTETEMFIAIVDNTYVVPATVAVDTPPSVNLEITLGTAVTAGQTVQICALPGILEDTETTPNENVRIVDFDVVNNVV